MSEETKAEVALRDHLTRRGRVLGRQSPSDLADQSSVFNDRNIELFTRRLELIARLAPLLEIDPADLTPVQTRQMRQLDRRLDQINEDIVQTNYGLVRGYVRRFTSNTSADDSQDFEAAARFGLMRAIASYDPTKGKFAQWAFKPIQREVLRAVRDADHPNMNHTDFTARGDILRAVTRLVREKGDDYAYTFDEVAALASVTVEQVTRVLNAPRLDSLATPVGDDAGTTLGDLIEEPGDGLEESVMSRISVTALENYGLVCLDERELFVIVRRFGLDGEPRQRLSTIGETLGLSREAVRQVERKGIDKISHPTILKHLVHAGRP